MISYPKSVLKLPTIGNIVDTGTYLGFGNLVLNKNLTLAGIDRKFDIQRIVFATGNIVNGWNIDSSSLGGSLKLAGNNCMLAMGNFQQLNGSSGYLLSYAKPSGWQTFCFDTYKSSGVYTPYVPYFTSTMGNTSGSTFTLIQSDLYQTNTDGTISFISNGYVNWVYEKFNTIIAENTNYLYGLSFVNGAYNSNTASTQANFSFFSINKTSNVLSQLGTLTNARQYWANAPKILGTTLDNKLVVACYPVPSLGTSLTYGSLYYYILDMTANTVSQSTTGLTISGSATVTTCAVPSAISDESSDSTKWKYYIPVCDATSTVATGVKRVYLPKTLGSQVSPLAGDVTSCTLTGLTTSIPNPNNAPTTNTSAATSACFYLNQIAANTKEYVVVINMGYANVTGTLGYNKNTGFTSVVNGCDVARHGLFVFQIDPTNSANLIYKSYVMDSAFGVNAPLFNINKSTDNTIFVLSNETQFVILTWNSATESYTYSRTYTISEGIGRISMDITNQIWIHSHTTANVYVYQLNNSLNVEIKFSNNVSTLDYSGTNLTQNVIVNCYNLAGVRQAKSVTLAVSGSATFTSTNTQAVTFTTLTTGDTSIGLTITGAGTINVTPTTVV